MSISKKSTGCQSLLGRSKTPTTRRNRRLTAEAREAGADSLIYEALGPHTRIRTGAFSLSELVGWHLVFRDCAGSVLGIGVHGANEGFNRVNVGPSSLLARTRIECIGEGIGMPDGMLRMAER